MTNRRIINEYTLIEGVNNSFKNAKELSELLKDLPCHVNVIRLNEVEGRDLKAPSQDDCKKFVDYLNRFGVSATIRRTLGDDIEGACGMLRNTEIKDGQVVEKTRNVVAHSRPKPNANTKAKVKDVSKLNRMKETNNKFKSKQVSNKNKLQTR